MDITHFSGLRNLSLHFCDSKYSAVRIEVEDQIAHFAFTSDKQNRLLHYQLERALGINSITIGLLFPLKFCLWRWVSHLLEPYQVISLLNLIASELWNESYPRLPLTMVKIFFTAFG